MSAAQKTSATEAANWGGAQEPFGLARRAPAMTPQPSNRKERTARRNALALSLVLATLIATSPAKAETFKSADFLKWKRESQRFYLDASIGMAGLIASFNDKESARCVEDWYFTDQAKAEDVILDAMKRFPDYHPRGVIVAVLQKACGDFKYTDR